MKEINYCPKCLCSTCKNKKKCLECRDCENLSTIKCKHYEPVKDNE
jgi:hypothetical protein